MANTSNEVYAAISMALHEHFGNNVHDDESGVLTIVPRKTNWSARRLPVVILL